MMTIYMIMLILTSGGPIVMRACVEAGKTDVSSVLKELDVHETKITLDKDDADKIEAEMWERARNDECLDFLCELRRNPFRDDEPDGLPFH